MMASKRKDKKMQFRPCIDIHNGKVKQIVGGSLCDVGDVAEENFVSEQDAAFFAKLYQKEQLSGGHIILLNGSESPFYEETKNQAIKALRAYPKGLQVGGGMNASNAKEFLENGASHIIVTSYVFRDGEIHYNNLQKLVETVGKEKLVLDLSCRKKEDSYYIVTERWQNFTKEKVSVELLEELSQYCDEFLIHAVDVEGKSRGIEKNLVRMLGEWEGIPITYAGGIANFSDLEELSVLGKGKLNVTIGSALDLFGGPMAYAEVMEFIKRK